MSFSKERREQIKRYMLEKIDDNPDDVVKKTSEAFNISMNTVYRYLRELETANIIYREKRQYRLYTSVNSVILSRSAGQLASEDKIYMIYIEEYLRNLPDNVQHIWQYAFMEMMNNAIDHSGAEKVEISILVNYLNTIIMINDNGIGIFKKIMEYYNYDSLEDAIDELFKGKLTTDSQNHSGEGIFFTSRVLDRFAAISDGKIFTRDKFQEILQNLENTPSLAGWKNRKGTLILMELSNYSNKILKEVFDMFSDEDGGFTRTHIPIKNIYETFPVSRSQAKRLCNRFDKFAEIELDFQGIEEIGQGFAHEIFVVFQNNHPGIKLFPVNMTPSVEKMINHVKKTNI